MDIKRLKVGVLKTDCYVVKDGQDCFVVDPGDEAKEILKVIEDCNLQFILLTHGHFDHTLALESIYQKYPRIAIYINKADSKFLEDPFWQSDYSEHDLKSLNLPTKNAKQGDVIQFSKHQIKVIETPGHSEGGVCYLVDGNLFSGDTLFYHTIGRTDLPSSDHVSMLSSLKKLAKLPPETKVYPGHGHATTIAEELTNGYLARI